MEEAENETETAPDAQTDAEPAGTWPLIAALDAHESDTIAEGLRTVRNATAIEILARHGWTVEGSRVPPPAPKPNPFDVLTPTQLQVAILLAQGKSCREIGEIRECSAKTIDTHRHAVLSKLDLNNTVELALLAVEHGMLS